MSAFAASAATWVGLLRQNRSKLMLCGNPYSMYVLGFGDTDHAEKLSVGASPSLRVGGRSSMRRGDTQHTAHIVHDANIIKERIIHETHAVLRSCKANKGEPRRRKLKSIHHVTMLST